jgi:hypothetical protein
MKYTSICLWNSGFLCTILFVTLVSVNFTLPLKNSVEPTNLEVTWCPRNWWFSDWLWIVKPLEGFREVQDCFILKMEDNHIQMVKVAAQMAMQSS